MNNLDHDIQSALDRTISTAPLPVPVETILSRVDLPETPAPRPYRRWAIAIPILAAVAIAVALVIPTNNRQSGSAVNLEAADADDIDQTEVTKEEALDTKEVTVPEGLWLSEVVPQVADQLPTITSDELWAALDQNKPQAPFVVESMDLHELDIAGLSENQLRWEGLLLPATYSFDSDDQAVDVIDRMHKEFVSITSELGYEQTPRMQGLLPYEVVVVASLVESAAASNDADRAKIATVIYNRLAEDLPIGIDSAYLYAAQDRELEFTQSLLDTPGPYALRHPTKTGLPPTPIASASRASLLAAIEPTPGPWLFYSPADDEGSYHFAATLAEHNANLAAAHEQGLLD